MIKQLAGSIREFKKYAILSPICVAFEVLLEVTIPFLMAGLLDKGLNVTGGGNMAEIWKYGLLLVLCAAVSLFFGAACGVTSSRAAMGFARNLRHDMYFKVQDYSFANIDKFSTASIITRLTTDVNNCQMAFMIIMRVLVRAPMMMIFALIYCFRTNVQMTWIFLAAVPVLAIGLFLLMTHAHPTFEKVFRKYDRLNEVVEEDLRGVRVVKAFVREDYERKKFYAASEEIYKLFVRAERILSFNQPLLMLIMYVCQLLVYWLGAQIIVNTGSTELSVGQLSSFMNYATMILMSLMMLSQVFVMLTMARASAERVCEVLRPVQALVTAPCFSGYEQPLDRAGTTIVRHPLRDEDDFALTDRILDEPLLSSHAHDTVSSGGRTRDVVFLCNPNNPTGLTVPRSLIERIVDAAARVQVTVVLDECFLDFTDEPSAVPSCMRYPNLIVMRAFTKLYAMAGLRLGYGICSDDALVERIARTGQPWAVSTPAQVAGLAALGVRGWDDRTRAYVDIQRERLADALTACGMRVIPGKANFLLFRSGHDLYEPLLECGFLIRRCGNFEGLDGSWYRIAVRTRDENTAFIAALEEVCR